MAEIYDNWERLVRATLRREELRLIALRTPSDLSTGSASPSSNFTSPSPSASSLNFSNTLVGDPFAYPINPQAQYDLSSINLIKHGRRAHRFNGAQLGAVAERLDRYLSIGIQTQSQYAIQFVTQFKELRQLLKYMTLFIANASQLQDCPETVKTTLATLEELIYEADDLVVDCQIREDYQKMKGSSVFPLSLSKISFRSETRKKLTNVNSQIKRMREDLITYCGPITGHLNMENNNERENHWSFTCFEESDVVGLKEDVDTIKEWILGQNEQLLRLAIVGLGGSGKTTLAKMIYRDASRTNHFLLKIWISVSQSVNVVEIMKSMLKQLNVDDRGASKSDMLDRIHKLLSEKPYLIVLDDVWSIEDGWWDRISSGLPRIEGHKSCILITSRIPTVVKQMQVLEERIHQPKLLDDEESWELFKKVAKMSGNDEKNTELVKVGKEIVSKCGGLPLAIKIVGGLLSLVNKSDIDWARICKNFQGELTSLEGKCSKGSESVMASLQLSYDELPARLKQCILCFSIYPEDHEIDVDQLIQWWEGEGFVRGNRAETVTESALNCLSELIGRCLVEVGQRRYFDGRAYTCKVHDMVRDLTIKIAGEEDFCSFNEDGKHIAKASSRRLGVTSETTFQTLRGNSKLRALLLTTTHHIGFNRNMKLAKVKSLRVLNLSQVSLDGICVKDLWHWITSLKRLAYLNLGNVANLFEVPNSIGKLWGLQILILRECKNLKKLPPSIVKLPRLIILDVGNCPNLQCAPQRFSRLSNLQELYGFKIAGAGNAAGSHLGDLMTLTELRVLQIDITEESTIQEKELEVLAKLQKLRVLSINAGDCRDKDILGKLDTLSLPSSIEELYLKQYFGETTPQWINPKSLPQLQYLCIEDSRTKEMTKGFWGDKDHKWDLKGLCLKFCQRLHVSWQELRAVMPDIRYLEVSQCHLLDSFPCEVKAVGFWIDQEASEKRF